MARIYNEISHKYKYKENQTRSETMMDWIKSRSKEESSHHGAGILLACLLIVAFGGLAKILAYVGIAYSIWRICKKG